MYLIQRPCLLFDVKLTFDVKNDISHPPVRVLVIHKVWGPGETFLMDLAKICHFPTCSKTSQWCRAPAATLKWTYHCQIAAVDTKLDL